MKHSTANTLLLDRRRARIGPVPPAVRPARIRHGRSESRRARRSRCRLRRYRFLSGMPAAASVRGSRLRLVFPADDLAAGQAGRDGVAIDRTVDIVLDVLLARPHHFYRPLDLLGDANGHRPPCQARACGRSRRRADDCGPSLCRPVARPPLRFGRTRAMICVPVQISQVRLAMNRGVQRTVVAWARNGNSNDTSNFFTGREALGDIALRFGDHAVLFAGSARILHRMSFELRRAFGPSFHSTSQSASRPFLARPRKGRRPRRRSRPAPRCAHARSSWRRCRRPCRPCRRKPGAPASRISCPAAWRRCRRRPCR